MKIKIELDNRRILILSAVLIFIILGSVVATAQRTSRTQQNPTKQPNIAVQFGSSFACMITQCGWPALVFLILPAIAVYIWKKVFSVG